MATCAFMSRSILTRFPSLQLAAEREISSRRERDFEAQRSEWDDEIARLQDSLRKVEAFRRENEAKLQPIKLQV